MQSRKGWSEIEDDRLIKIIKKYGMKNWTLISEKLSLGGTQERTGKQCRERWHNNLNPAITNNEWTNKEDEMLFEAHRKYGSKWKQISKLFEGRTDNSIKNHFYSTVRCCLRRISKVKGERHSTASMKSIKPYVLSKIVQNTELTNLILHLGSDNSRATAGTAKFEIDQNTVNHIHSQLKRISNQYSQKQNKTGEHSPLAEPLPTNKSAASGEEDSKLEDLDDHPQASVKRMVPEDEGLQCYFEEEVCKQNAEGQDLIMETQQEEKARIQPAFKTAFRCFQEESSTKEKLETAEKQAKEVEKDEQIWIQEEESHNFFNSPSCGKKNKFAYLRLLSKISRNSQSEGVEHSEERISSNLKASWLKKQQQEEIEINYDPHELLNSSFEVEQQQQCL